MNPAVSLITGSGEPCCPESVSPWSEVTNTVQLSGTMSNIMSRLSSSQSSFSSNSGESLTMYLCPTLSSPERCATITFGVLS